MGYEWKSFWSLPLFLAYIKRSFPGTGDKIQSLPYVEKLIVVSCQRSDNTVFEMHCPKPIRGPEFQLSKSRSTELYWEQAVSVPALLNANELRLPATRPSQEEDASC